MKRLSIITITLAAFSAIGSLSSCQDEDFGYESKEIEYQTAFKKSFGTPDANHTWGFVDMPSVGTAPTRADRPEANIWKDTYNLDVPLPLSDRQKDFVTKWFTETKNPTGIAVSWTDYFAQQVSSTEKGRNMDLLLDAGHGYTDHIYNFNSGNCSPTNVNSPNAVLLNGGQYADRIMYMYDQSTKDFAYHESVSDPNTTWYDHYVIIPGKLIDPENSLASNTVQLRDDNGKLLKNPETGENLYDGSIWGMYFIGFDYEAIGHTQQRDYYFNDWIIKITPGLVKTEAKRIMAEDLGLIGDFDFNDVVFDAYINYNQNWPAGSSGVIVLQAAGGTMELYVDGHEVHEEFGVETNTVVNVGENPNDPYATKEPVLWHFTPISANPIDIPITVKPKDGVEYSIGTERGKAPGKFAVPTTVQWSPEIVNIKTTYPKFPEWVQDESKHFW